MAVLFSLRENLAVIEHILVDSQRVRRITVVSVFRSETSSASSAGQTTVDGNPISTVNGRVHKSG